MNLVLKKGGKIFLKKWVYNAEIEKGKYQKTFVNFQDKENIDDSYLLSLLQYDVQLEKGFTVRDWFKLVINYPIYKKLDLFIPSYLEEYYKCPLENCTDPDNNIVRIDFEKVINFTKYKNLKLNHIDSYINITGRSEKENINYSLSFWGIENYLDTPMYLNKACICIEWDKEIKSERGVVGYTLYEFLHSFIYEISFYGTPSQTEKESKKLKGVVKEVLQGKTKTKEYKIKKKVEKKKR